MKKYLTTLLAACCMLAAFSMPASALEYHFDGPDAGLFIFSDSFFIAVMPSSSIFSSDLPHLSSISA